MPLLRSLADPTFTVNVGAKALLPRFRVKPAGQQTAAARKYSSQFTSPDWSGGRPNHPRADDAWYLPPMSRAPKLLFASPQGEVMEHPELVASVRSGEHLLPANGRCIGIPSGARLVHLPGRLPVGVDPKSGKLELLDRVRVAGKTITPSAVGALLPPGYTRTLLPGEVKASGPVLPQWAYTAAGWRGKGAVVWAMRTDRRRHWEPMRFSTPELDAMIAARRAQFPRNRVLAQLERCARVYRCFTSQNIFYGRDEGAVPASVSCNARCVGCISEQPSGGPPASHSRISDGPSAEEMAEIGALHLSKARGRTMISFGQGCEGEPLMRYRAIAEAIRSIRRRTARGSININTNGSRPGALAALFDAGLDAVRISLNSVNRNLYEAYYQPVGYGWDSVEASIRLARERGAYLAINLLLFPGVTDRLGEVAALEELIHRHRIDQLQARSLCIDPLQYLQVAHGKGGRGNPVGVGAMLSRLKKGAPWLVIGNFARALGERRGREARSPLT
jgi:wyosine [tRNA(Phe)-imidazoG37] synthetase (radical SAM superfamily)